jgi:isocitrate dehydrogenase
LGKNLEPFVGGENAAVATVEKGVMTGDLAKLAEPAAIKICSTLEFIEEIAKTVEAAGV